MVKATNFKIDVTELKKQIANDRKLGLEPFFLVGTVGTTKTGSVDPINELADLALQEKLWLHADGAYGALFMLTEKGRELLRGINRADSIALDQQSLSGKNPAACNKYASCDTVRMLQILVTFLAMRRSTFDEREPVPLNMITA